MSQHYLGSSFCLEVVVKFWSGAFRNYLVNSSSDVNICSSSYGGKSYLFWWFLLPCFYLLCFLFIFNSCHIKSISFCIIMIFWCCFFIKNMEYNSNGRLYFCKAPKSNEVILIIFMIDQKSHRYELMKVKFTLLIT